MFDNASMQVKESLRVLIRAVSLHEAEILKICDENQFILSFLDQQKHGFNDDSGSIKLPIDTVGENIEEVHDLSAENTNEASEELENEVQHEIKAKEKKKKKASKKTQKLIAN